MKNIAIFFLVFFCIQNSIYSQIDSDLRLKRKRNKFSISKKYRPTPTYKNKKNNIDNSRSIFHENDIVSSSDNTEPDLVPIIKELKGIGNTSVLTGKIIEKDTHENLMDAIIQIEGKNLATLTNLDGDFKIENIPAGKHKIVIRYMGYVSRIITVNFQAGKEYIFESIGMFANGIGIKEVEIISSFSKNPPAPISISTLDYNYIVERNAGQGVPELLKLTPGVYTSKVGGGYGDSRINIRGFDQTNVAVMINGIPVNDMESGRVFWSNWLSVGDVARTIQVQRGLGASKVAINSIGGTMNVITKTTDIEKGGAVSLESTSNYSSKISLQLSTGRNKKGWAMTFAGSQTSGSGYIDQTNLSVWSYFLSISKEIGIRHILSFTAFGSPQEHDQRLTSSYTKTYKERNNLNFNPDWGYFNGKPLSTTNNYYHKPQVAINHYFHINDKINLVSSVYCSFGRGGGSGVFIANKYKLKTDAAGQLDLEAAKTNNRSQIDTVHTSQNGMQTGYGSDMVIANAVNNHNWFGALSVLNYKIDPRWKLMAGADLRYYDGYHYREIDNLLGGDFFIDKRDKNNPVRAAKVGDIFDYNYDGRVRWGGVFGQIEFNNEKICAFVSSSLSMTAQQRFDHFLVKGYGETSRMMTFPGYNIKAGISYKIDRNSNVYINGGTFSRAPFFNFLFVDRKRGNDLSMNPVNEKVLSTEIGFTHRSQYFSADASLYYTVWRDKGNNFTYYDNSTTTTRSANITGIGARHMGLEIEGQIKPFEVLQIRLMGSLGDWRWQNDVNAVLTNELNQETHPVQLAIKDLHVGDAAQTTASIGIKTKILKKIYAIVDFSYYAHLYANFNPETRLIGPNGETDRSQPYQLPDFGLFDLHIGYDFNIHKYQFALKGSLMNALDKKYISEGIDGKNHSESDLSCFYGFGRNFSLSLQMKF